MKSILSRKSNSKRFSCAVANVDWKRKGQKHSRGVSRLSTESSSWTVISWPRPLSWLHSEDRSTSSGAFESSTGRSCSVSEASRHPERPTWRPPRRKLRWWSSASVGSRAWTFPSTADCPLWSAAKGKKSNQVKLPEVKTSKIVASSYAILASNWHEYCRTK